MTSGWSEGKILQMLGTLRQWSRGEERAPHKPLLILLALAHLQQGSGRLVPFEEIELKLGILLEQFGPPRQRNNPAYPFWRLQNDGVWEVQTQEPLEVKATRDPSILALRNEKARGGFVVEVFDFLRNDPQLVAQATRLLLDQHFAPSLHEEILSSIGLEVTSAESTVHPKQTSRRDPFFARRVLEAYEFRCAICGYDGLLINKLVGVEAAHVKWFAYSGPDIVENGLSLCSIHHKALDLGAIGLSPERKILVSQAFRGGARWEEFFRQYSGRGLHGPQNGQPAIAKTFQQWHFSQVFRSPARPL